MTRYPWGYGVSTKTLAEIEAILTVHYHPEYLRRLLAWLEAQDGRVGIGGHWRAGGAQPDRPGFAPEGRSFHQDQRYADGFVGACAVDLVVRRTGLDHRSPYWSEVPAQGSDEARRWGLHCNVGAPPGGEPWHMQPIEIDGWVAWDVADLVDDGIGRAPVPGYPFPGREEIAMQTVNKRAYSSEHPDQVDEPYRSLNAGVALGPFARLERRRIQVDAQRVQVSLTAYDGPGGNVRISGRGVMPSTSIANMADRPNSNTWTINTPESAIYVWCTQGGHVALDIVEAA